MARNTKMHKNKEAAFCNRIASGVKILSIISAIMLGISTARAQISATPINIDSSLQNSIGTGVSYGEILNKNADFWGMTVDYTRIFQSSWSTGISLAFDRETDRDAGKPKNVTDTYSLVWIVSYSLNRTLTLTTGLSKGIANDDNPDRDVKFTSGDWGTGIALGSNFPVTDRLTALLGCAWEWNISDREPSVSCDLGVGFGF